MPDAAATVLHSRESKLASRGLFCGRPSSRSSSAALPSRRLASALLAVVLLSIPLEADSCIATTARLGLGPENGPAWKLRAGYAAAIRRVTPHWDSSLLLDAGGEDIQLQIVRATWGRIGQESRRSVMFLPPGSAGIVLLGRRNPALESDFYRDVVVKVIRKLLYPSRLGKKRNPPRCRHNPDGPGCG